MVLLSLPLAEELASMPTVSPVTPSLFAEVLPFGAEDVPYVSKSPYSTQSLASYTRTPARLSQMPVTRLLGVEPRI